MTNSLASKLTVFIGTYVPTQSVLVLTQIAMFVATAFAIMQCPFGSIWSILSMCVAVFFFVGNCLLIVDYKGASSVNSILKCTIISNLCIIIGYLA